MKDSDEVIVDLSNLSAFCRENKKRMSEYIRVFLIGSARQMEDLNAKALSNDLKEFKIIAHSLKPQFQFMGMKKMNSLISELEQFISIRQEDRIQPTLTELNKIFEKSCSRLIESLVVLA